MTPASPSRLPQLLLPKEHGSWSLALEPIALALLIAPSAAGAALALAGIAGFFTRRPLKFAVTLPAGDPRRVPARNGAIFFALFAAATLGVAAVLGPARAFWPLLTAVPFGAFFLWFDLRNAAREAEAELAGSIVFALLPATGAMLAGWPAPAALALAALALARNAPTVLTVRTYLRLGKGENPGVLPPVAASGVALATVALLTRQGLVPSAATAVSAVFLARTCWLVSPLRPSWPARRVGIMEAILGLAQLGVLAAAYRLR